MVLRVEIDRFAEEVRARLEAKECYVAPWGPGSLATAGNADRQLILAAFSSHSVEATTQELTKSGLSVHSGHWALTVEDMIEAQPKVPYIGAVAYRSKDQKPGLWLDAYPTEPSPGEVLMAIFNEFQETGDLAEVSFEDFMKGAHPNVVIMTPDQIGRFLQQKEPEC